MEKMILASLAIVVFCATSVSALCDNTTAAKVKECVFTSELFKPDMLLTNDGAVTSYCSANATVNCLQTQLGACTEDDRQTKLINSLLTKEAIVKGQMDMCNSTGLGDQSACYAGMAESTTLDCLKAAVGVVENVGDVANLKTNLDSMCTFFDAYTKCFEGKSCEVFVEAMNGIRYGYCSMSEDGKKTVISDYETGSASFITVSIVSVVIALVASFLF